MQNLSEDYSNKFLVKKERFVQLESALRHLQTEIKPEYLLSRHENDLSFGRLVLEVKMFLTPGNDTSYLPNNIFQATSQTQAYVVGKKLIAFLEKERQLLMAPSDTDDYSLEDYCTGFYKRLYTYIE